MAVPTMNKVMGPLLRRLENRNWNRLELRDELIGQLIQDPAEREHQRAKGSKFESNYDLATSHLRKAGLLTTVSKGPAVFGITAEGRSALARCPNGMSETWLKHEYPGYRPQRQSKPKTLQQSPSNQDLEVAAKDAYAAWRSAFADEVLTWARNLAPGEFEELVLLLLVKIGYGGSPRDARRVGRSGDGGIDGLINLDPLGLDKVYVQTKRWTRNSVGPAEVREFNGAMDTSTAAKGVLVTTGRFSPDAQVYISAQHKSIVLIDGARLADLMIEHGIGVTDTATYTLKRIDEDYFEG